MPQFPIPPGKRVGDTVLLGCEDSRHLTTVLRAGTGETVRLFDGTNQFEGQIREISPQGTKLRLIRLLVVKPLKGEVVLCQSLLKGEKMEFVIQKAVELGAKSIIPFRSERSIPSSIKKEKISRWQKIADEALKQCGRVHRMTVCEEGDFTNLLREKGGRNILFDDSGERLKLREETKVRLFVGPEGGFSEPEVLLAKKEGCQIASLGNLTLRAETATITALTLIQHGLGNL